MWFFLLHVVFNSAYLTSNFIYNMPSSFWTTRVVLYAVLVPGISLYCKGLIKWLTLFCFLISTTVFRLHRTLCVCVCVWLPLIILQEGEMLRVGKGIKEKESPILLLLTYLLLAFGHVTWQFDLSVFHIFDLTF